MPWAVLLDALDSSTRDAPKKAFSARKSSIRNEVVYSGRSRACSASRAASQPGSALQRLYCLARPSAATKSARS